MFRGEVSASISTGQFEATLHLHSSIECWVRARTRVELSSWVVLLVDILSIPTTFSRDIWVSILWIDPTEPLPPSQSHHRLTGRIVWQRQYQFYCFKALGFVWDDGIWILKVSVENYNISLEQRFVIAIACYSWYSYLLLLYGG